MIGFSFKDGIPNSIVFVYIRTMSTMWTDWNTKMDREATIQNVLDKMKRRRLVSVLGCGVGVRGFGGGGKGGKRGGGGGGVIRH